MSQVPAHKIVDEIVKRGLHPLLKAAGYKKRGRTFYHESDDVIQVVNVQSSQGNTAELSKFTINLGVFFPLVREISQEPPLNGLPKEYHCTLRQRIGFLMPQHDDYWWVATPLSDIDHLASEVAEAWDSYGEGWILRISNLNAARDEAERTGNTIMASMISVALLDKVRAKELFDVAYEKSSPHAHKYLESWAIHHNLLQ
ncbi:DUF4304 domain-containing protein [Gimesia aquarii]|uniref:DUF4304 domain-containing protein n=1 Tax=Gimesia aquarii TaxID=2527964 RepID=A0A517VQF7_9PLAN|nr:DUF4304 domain-containing protein [Gimesia aquarii]QDT95258.1 hypothetical protein V144x_07000 [Gimesia aquarii]